MPPTLDRGAVDGAGAARATMLLVGVIWGLNWPSAKFALMDFSPWMFRTVSFGVSAAILFMVAKQRGVSLVLRDGRQGLHLAVAGLLNIGGFGILAAFAQLGTTTSRTAICAYTMPIWATLLARLFLGERLDRWRGSALAIGAFGLLVLLWPLVIAGLPMGVVYALGSAIVWAMGTVYLKWACIDAPLLSIAAWQLVAGTVAVAIGWLLADAAPDRVVHIASVAGLLYSTLIGTALAYLLWFQCIGRLPAGTAGLGTLLVPVVGVLASAILLGDRPSPADLIGFALIFIAAIFALAAPAHGKAAPNIEEGKP